MVRKAKVKPLVETNPYLIDPVQREKLISRSVRTSCGVEGIKAPKASPHEDYMVDLIKNNTKEEVVREYRFHDTRRWRFDAAIPSLRLAFECEGGTWSKGRHVNPAGYEKDLEKYNTALFMGWSVYRFVPRMLNQGWIERILKQDEPRTN